MRCAFCRREIQPSDATHWLDNRLNLAFCKYEHIILYTFDSGEVVFAEQVNKLNEGDVQ